MKNIILSLCLGVLLLACGQPNAPTASSSPSVANTPAAGASPGSAVEVSAEGTRFDPAVPVEQMPTGAWACVMKGTVHYAAMEKGEGKCPVCKMKLVQHDS